MEQSDHKLPARIEPLTILHKIVKGVIRSYHLCSLQFISGDLITFYLCPCFFQEPDVSRRLNSSQGNFFPGQLVFAPRTWPWPKMFFGEI